MRIIICDIWHCHDGWANSVTIFKGGKIDEAADLKCRQQFNLWYRSARTREGAEKRMREKIAMALSIVGNCDVAEQGSARANEYFSAMKEAA